MRGSLDDGKMGGGGRRVSETTGLASGECGDAFGRKTNLRLSHRGFEDFEILRDQSVLEVKTGHAVEDHALAFGLRQGRRLTK